MPAIIPELPFRTPKGISASAEGVGPSRRSF
jgi:hypothetical protein